MIRYILDTDILTLYQEGHTQVCQNVAAHSSEKLALCIISVEEQLSGWFTMIRRTSDRQRQARLYQRFTENTVFLARLNIVSFSLSAMDRFDSLRASRLNIGIMDLRIAAIALDSGCRLVTRKRRDFQRVPGLPHRGLDRLMPWFFIIRPEVTQVNGTYTVAAIPDLRTPSAAGSSTRTLTAKTWCRRSSIDCTFRGVNSL